VRISSDRRHVFPVPPAELWRTMARVDQYQEWWPWLRSFDGTDLVVGQTWSAVIQPPLPYRLRFEIHLDEVDAPATARALVTGDIVGTAHIEIGAVPGGSELHLTSELAPARPLLEAMSRLAGPIARFGHRWVLDTGLRQFRDQAL
jgi:hypothetical protein